MLATAIVLATAVAGACTADSGEARPDRALGPTAPQLARSPNAAHAAHAAPAAQGSGSLDPEVQAALARLRAATARFHSLEAAEAAGYDTRVTGCLSNPAAGGMGVHYADVGRLDASVDAMRPEILVYAPGPNGKLRLVAVEYAVPLGAWTQAAPPALFGIPFHVNTTFGLWVLHAWVWEPNPAGTFADWNPRVTCPAS